MRAVIATFISVDFVTVSSGLAVTLL